MTDTCKRPACSRPVAEGMDGYCFACHQNIRYNGTEYAKKKESPLKKELDEYERSAFRARDLSALWLDLSHQKSYDKRN